VWTTVGQHNKTDCTSACKEKVKYSLEQAMQAQRGSKGMLHSFFNISARWGWVVNPTSRLLHPWERDPVPTVQEAGRAPGPVWKGAENLAWTRIQSLDHPVCSESLYRLHYPKTAIYEIHQASVATPRSSTITTGSTSTPTPFLTIKYRQQTGNIQLYLL